MKYEGPKVSDVCWTVSTTRHVVSIGLCVAIAFLVFVFAGIHRYPVGQPVPAPVYTEPFDPCDPAYKFIQTNYGEPNKPKWQAAPDDWVRKFGNNERTMLIHAVSELRVVVASLSKEVAGLKVTVADLTKRLADLEEWQKEQPVWIQEPNAPSYGLYRNGTIYPILPKDPNEVKK